MTPLLKAVHTWPTRWVLMSLITYLYDLALWFKPLYTIQPSFDFIFYFSHISIFPEVYYSHYWKEKCFVINKLGKCWIEQNKATLFLSFLDPLNMLIYTVNLVNANMQCKFSIWYNFPKFRSPGNIFLFFSMASLRHNWNFPWLFAVV